MIILNSSDSAAPVIAREGRYPVDVAIDPEGMFSEIMVMIKHLTAACASRGTQNNVEAPWSYQMHSQIEIGTTQRVVIAEMERIAAQYEKKLAPLSVDTVLANCGLDSLCFAVLVVRLEEQLGVDPFSSSESVGFPATLREFVHVYENAPK
jgi:hypothetical protein